ncbi:TnsA-like heteromeric transposase endonuclease subunit [Cellulomonas cellasea]|uniref:TnsA endonuclease N-terminal domain-containing protein n=1 Tax=Cellulomonas cellasea TaxID=43670 RepID=A0A7W4YAV4_9CELL|nr:TnsA-like heteromeric transposase endonuclease subunit [Cellulomonas cellasea]MBB2923185.1 hypothetical protein [Cellulomonas cellasea]
MGTAVTRAMYRTADGLEREAPLAGIDALEAVQGVPVRIPPSYAGQSNYPGLFWSATMRAHVVYESRLELSWLWLADFDSHVVGIAAQPLYVVGDDGGRTRTRYPDFLCVMAEGRVVVVDVKPEEMLKKPAVRESLDWTARVMQERGWEYLVWMGAPKTTLRNVRLLAAARRSALVGPSLIEAAAEACPPGGAALGHLQQELRRSLPGAARSAIFAALWWHRLSCDLSTPLDSRTWVTRA